MVSKEKKKENDCRASPVRSNLWSLFPIYVPLLSSVSGRQDGGQEGVLCSSREQTKKEQDTLYFCWVVWGTKMFAARKTTCFFCLWSSILLLEEIRTILDGDGWGVINLARSCQIPSSLVPQRQKKISPPSFPFPSVFFFSSLLVQCVCFCACACRPSSKFHSRPAMGIPLNQSEAVQKSPPSQTQETKKKQTPVSEIRYPLRNQVPTFPRYRKENNGTQQRRMNQDWGRAEGGMRAGPANVVLQLCPTQRCTRRIKRPPLSLPSCLVSKRSVGQPRKK